MIVSDERLAFGGHDSRSLGLAVAVAACLFGISAWAGETPGKSRGDAPQTDPAAIEFFEKSVRPILAERCMGCHGPSKQKGGLRLDARAAVLAGGSTGPAVVPGNTKESLLVDAINYGEMYQMPPKSKLPDAEIATLTEWVRRGVPWGIDKAGTASRPGSASEKSKSEGLSKSQMEERSRYWSFQPIQRTIPPAPAETWRSWPRNVIDRFILAGLHQHGLTPAPEADKRVLIRRLSFDLIGLPPTPDEIEAFLADHSPDAYEKLVERLLASPHHGERWARHWLDLVRFAETAGHEYDYEIQNAFRYRDYVIRALNADLAYDRFVIEQIAGDLLESPRRNPAAGFNESIIGTGFYFLGDSSHSPVDAREDEMRRIDNQIDVLSKTFLGLTLACARCHDHKFDPITSKDYYALAGYLHSSRYQQAFIDDAGRLADDVGKLRRLKQDLVAGFQDGRASLPGVFQRWLERFSQVRDAEPPGEPLSKAQKREGEPLSKLARTEPRPPSKLSAQAARTEPRPPSRPSAQAARTEPRPFSKASARAARTEPRPPVVFEDFNHNSFNGWFVTGDAFGDRPSQEGDFRLVHRGDTTRLVSVKAGQAHSGLLADRLQGVIRSPSFTIEARYIHHLAAGRGGRINIVIDNYEKIRDPIYGGLTVRIDHGDELRWVTQDLGMWLGHTAYVEIADGAVADFGGTSSHLDLGSGYIAVDEIRMSHQPDPGAAGENAATDSAELDLDAAIAALRPAGAAKADRLAAILDNTRTIAARLPEPLLALAISDGTGQDEHVHIRGSHKTLGEVVPRRFLEVLGGSALSSNEAGCGRLELAQRIVDPTTNPLLARVMVNRLWKHHFGEGIVKSTDDFGAMGQKPSHPALLDWLASEFAAQGWSIKAMHRLMVNSSTYRMSSNPRDPGERLDPSNVYLHRMNIRRLEAEAIRDCILSVSGRLDNAMYGPAVPLHLTSFMDGRGRPARSGPLDGDGRRSIYLNVRRNFLNPLFLAFDAPVPFSTMGRRNASNVPAQALALLNDPLVINQAKLWAEQELARPCQSPRARIDRLYVMAFGRPARDEEAQAGIAFMAAQAQLRAGHSEVQREPSAAAWADFCHVLLNVKSFIFID